MKKLSVLIVLLLFSGIAFNQTLEKGNLIGIHVFEFNLNPDVTLNQVQEFTLNKMIPEFEKHFGCKVYSLKAIRGVNKFKYGMMHVYKNEEARNKFWNVDGSPSELGNSTLEKLQPVIDEYTKKFGEYTSTYTDWIVQ